MMNHDEIKTETLRRWRGVGGHVRGLDKEIAKLKISLEVFHEAGYETIRLEEVISMLEGALETAKRGAK